MLEFHAIVSFFEIHIIAAYFGLFFAMVLEGETFLILAGVLSHLGALKLHYVMVVAFVGVMLGDILWYFCRLSFKA